MKTPSLQAYCFKLKKKTFWTLRSREGCVYNEKKNNFRGDLSNNSAKSKPLAAGSLAVSTRYLSYRFGHPEIYFFLHFFTIFITYLFRVTVSSENFTSFEVWFTGLHHHWQWLFLAEISVRSTRKLFTFIISKNISGYKIYFLFNFEKGSSKHCSYLQYNSCGFPRPRVVFIFCLTSYQRNNQIMWS